MAIKKNGGQKPAGAVTIQLQLAGLVIFSVALVTAAALVTFGLVKFAGKEKSGARLYAEMNADGVLDMEQTNMPPWGQLTVRDLDLEQPEEYVAYEIATNSIPQWIFENQTPEQARALMQSCGVPPEAIAAALSPQCLTVTGANTIVKPDRLTVLSLPPEVRAKFYIALSHFNGNQLIQFPFCFPGKTFETWFTENRIGAHALTLLKKTIYPRGDGQCFSDLETVLRELPDEAERMRLVKALSHQSAVLLGIRVWPDTDVDKLIGYWAWPDGVKLLDVKPLLESLKSRPNGGAAGIVYFLPPFARQRLYTYPLPSQAGDPVMDCHWSTMNFFNETPDNHFSNPAFTVNYLKQNYYQIAKATAYGDRIFLLDKNGNAIHSAVYLADDIVFTKNGNNYAQPWMLMHLKNLLSEYTADAPPQVAVYRSKSN